MKLKSILTEIFKDPLKKAKVLDQKLKHENYRNDEETIIWRGMDVGISYWGEYEIKPEMINYNVGFKVFTEYFMECLANHAPYWVPQRKKASYGTTDKSYAKQFGDPHILFIKKDARFRAWKKDPLNIIWNLNKNINRVGIKLNNIDGDLKDVFKEDLDFLKFLKSIENIKIIHFDKPAEFNDEACEIIGHYVWNEMDWVKKMCYKYDKVLDSGKNLYKMLEEAIQYFEKMEKTIKPNLTEIIFVNGPYLLVNEDFFKKYFEWNGKIWDLKEKYKD